MNMRSDPALLARVFAEVVERRRSIRGFLPEPVPADKLREIFALAQRAPSNCNTQPWLVTVVSGARCERLRRVVSEAARGREFSADVPYNAELYRDVYKARQHDAAARLYGAMGIGRGDRAARTAAFMRNYEFYGAPHVALIGMPEFAGVREAADVGMYAQTLMLAMSAHGVDSCAQTSLGMHAQPIRAELDIPAGQQLLFGISFGYADRGAAANRAEIPRAGLEETTRFIE